VAQVSQHLIRIEKAMLPCLFKAFSTRAVRVGPCAGVALVTQLNVLQHKKHGLAYSTCENESFGVAMPGLGATPKTPEGATQLYDEWAKTYDITLKSWHYEAHTKTAELLEQLRGDSTAPFAVLDTGCGTGMSGEALRAVRGVGTLTGIDISPASLDYIRENKPGVYSKLAVADLEKLATTPLPFADDTFDAIVCVGVLSYVQNFAELYEEWIRVTRPGGLVIFTHRLWGKDDSKPAAEALQKQNLWTLVHESADSPYMPKNPDPEERAKRIKYIAFQLH